MTRRTQELVTGEIRHALGGASALKVVVKMGVFDLKVGGPADEECAVQGSYTTNPELEPIITYAVEGHLGILTIRQPQCNGHNLSCHDNEVALSLTAAVPVDLVIKGGVGEVALDLVELPIHSLRFDGGVGEIALTLPRRGSPDIAIGGGVGEIRVDTRGDTSELRVDAMRIHSGVGEVELALPNRGVYAIRIESGVGAIRADLPSDLPTSLRVNGASFLSRAVIQHGGLRSIGRGRWQTESYHTEAPHRAALDVRTGVGDVIVLGRQG